MQISAFFILKAFLVPFFVKKRSFPQEDRLFQLKYILVANHVSRLDAFVTLASLKYSTFKVLYPFAFIAHNNYLDRWWKRILLYPLGLYPAKPIGGKVKYGLEKSQELLEKGYTLMMFPEGTRTLPGKTRPKKGVVVLSTKNKLPLLPVRIKWEPVGKKRKKVVIKFGNPFCLLENNDFDDLAQFVMNYIYDL